MRRIAGLALALLYQGALAGCSSNAFGPARWAVEPNEHPASSSGSQSRAYTFLRLMMDKYGKGSTLRLVQSFDGGPLKNFTDAVTYDDALFVDAMLAQGMPDDIARAEIVGNAFLYVQAHDKAGDGRLRASYAPKPLQSPGDVVVRDNTSDVGNMAWVGQVLVRLYAQTSNTQYLDGALQIAQWLQLNAYDTRGAGGYTGGFTAGGSKIEWKSTEHNIDVYAFFTMLATESGDSQWTTHAAWAKKFVTSMWDAHDGRFYVGTAVDGKTANKQFKPEDVNSWSYLAFHSRSWEAAPTWDAVNLAVSAKGFNGVSFCSGDRSGVWFEGTAHLADALKLRDAPGDRTQAQKYIRDIAYAQTNGPNADGRGIIAASKNGLSDCDGSRYYASLHVGATAWYVLAANASDPFILR